jgi:hypothetical protein
MALPLLAFTAAACKGAIGGGDNRNGGGGSFGAGGGGGAAPPPPNPGFDLSCSAPNLGSPVLRLLNRTELDRTLSDIFPELAGQWTNTLPALNVSAYGFDNDAGAVVGAQLAGALLDTALSVGTAVIGTALPTLLPCASASPDRTCAEQFLVKYGRRLFRRAITTAEHDRFLAFYDTAAASSDFKTALKWMTAGLIQSPNAVYRSEIGAVASGGTRQLSPQELATELAYVYTGSTPSDALLSQAESGSLGDPSVQAQTLLATPAGQEVLQHFFESYLDYTRVVATDKQSIANFGAVRSDMVQEIRAFVADVVVRQRGGVSQLLTSPATYPSQALAQYYGFPAPAADYAAITRPSGRGIGILAQGAVLATHATANSSSPTQRGLLVFQRLLCETKPTLPDNVPPIPSPDPGNVTTRYRYETAHAVGSCHDCHKLFDPIGFGFEHFDEGGRYRADENGLAIDTNSEVPNANGDAIFTFPDQEGLMTGLVTQPVVSQCLAAHLATYAFGTADSCLGSSHVGDLQSGTVGVADYFSGLATEPHFSRRAAQ